MNTKIYDFKDMKNKDNSISKKTENIFQETLKKVEEGTRILVAYDGVINGKTIAKLELEIQEILSKLNLKTSLRKKLLLVSIEILQNQFHHGAKDDLNCQHNFFILSIDKEIISISSGNLVLKKYSEDLGNQLNFLNAIKDEALLKELYIKKLNEEDFSCKGGAGLGFLVTRIKMSKPIEYEFVDVDSHYSIFKIKTGIEMSKNENNSSVTFN